MDLPVQLARKFQEMAREQQSSEIDRQKMPETNWLGPTTAPNIELPHEPAADNRPLSMAMNLASTTATLPINTASSPKRPRAPRVALAFYVLFRRRFQRLSEVRPCTVPSRLVLLREKVLRPILAGVGKRKTGRKPQNWSLIDEHYETIQLCLLCVWQDKIIIPDSS
jgi:hypothetical protein